MDGCGQMEGSTKMEVSSPCGDSKDCGGLPGIARNLVSLLEVTTQNLKGFQFIQHLDQDQGDVGVPDSFTEIKECYARIQLRILNLKNYLQSHLPPDPAQSCSQGVNEKFFEKLEHWQPDDDLQKLEEVFTKLQQRAKEMSLKLGVMLSQYNTIWDKHELELANEVTRVLDFVCKLCELLQRENNWPQVINKNSTELDKETVVEEGVKTLDDIPPGMISSDESLVISISSTNSSVIEISELSSPPDVVRSSGVPRVESERSSTTPNFDTGTSVTIYQRPPQSPPENRGKVFTDQQVDGPEVTPVYDGKHHSNKEQPSCTKDLGNSHEFPPYTKSKTLNPGNEAFIINKTPSNHSFSDLSTSSSISSLDSCFKFEADLSPTLGDSDCSSSTLTNRILESQEVVPTNKSVDISEVKSNKVPIKERAKTMIEVASTSEVDKKRSTTKGLTSLSGEGKYNSMTKKELRRSNSRFKFFLLPEKDNNRQQTNQSRDSDNKALSLHSNEVKSQSSAQTFTHFNSSISTVKKGNSKLKSGFKCKRPGNESVCPTSGSKVVTSVRFPVDMNKPKNGQDCEISGSSSVTDVFSTSRSDFSEVSEVPSNPVIDGYNLSQQSNLTEQNRIKVNESKSKASQNKRNSSQKYSMRFYNGKNTDRLYKCNKTSDISIDGKNKSKSSDLIPPISESDDEYTGRTKKYNPHYETEEANSPSIRTSLVGKLNQILSEQEPTINKMVEDLGSVLKFDASLSQHSIDETCIKMGHLLNGSSSSKETRIEPPSNMKDLVIRTPSHSSTTHVNIDHGILTAQNTSVLSVDPGNGSISGTDVTTLSSLSVLSQLISESLPNQTSPYRRSQHRRSHFIRGNNNRRTGAAMKSQFKSQHLKRMIKSVILKLFRRPPQLSATDDTKSAPTSLIHSGYKRVNPGHSEGLLGLSRSATTINQVSSKKRRKLYAHKHQWEEGIYHRIKLGSIVQQQQNASRRKKRKSRQSEETSQNYDGMNDQRISSKKLLKDVHADTIPYLGEINSKLGSPDPLNHDISDTERKSENYLQKGEENIRASKVVSSGLIKENRESGDHHAISNKCDQNEAIRPPLNSTKAKKGRADRRPTDFKYSTKVPTQINNKKCNLERGLADLLFDSPGAVSVGLHQRNDTYFVGVDKSSDDKKPKYELNSDKYKPDSVKYTIKPPEPDSVKGVVRVAEIGNVSHQNSSRVYQKPCRYPSRQLALSGVSPGSYKITEKTDTSPLRITLNKTLTKSSQPVSIPVKSVDGKGTCLKINPTAPCRYSILVKIPEEKDQGGSSRPVPKKRMLKSNNNDYTTDRSSELSQRILSPGSSDDPILSPKISGRKLKPEDTTESRSELSQRILSPGSSEDPILSPKISARKLEPEENNEDSQIDTQPAVTTGLVRLEEKTKNSRTSLDKVSEKSRLQTIDEVIGDPMTSNKTSENDIRNNKKSTSDESNQTPKSTDRKGAAGDFDDTDTISPTNDIEISFEHSKKSLNDSPQKSKSAVPLNDSNEDQMPKSTDRKGAAGDFDDTDTISPTNDIAISFEHSKKSLNDSPQKSKSAVRLVDSNEDKTLTDYEDSKAFQDSDDVLKSKASIRSPKRSLSAPELGLVVERSKTSDKREPFVWEITRHSVADKIKRLIKLVTLAWILFCVLLAMFVPCSMCVNPLGSCIHRLAYSIYNNFKVIYHSPPPV